MSIVLLEFDHIVCGGRFDQSVGQFDNQLDGMRDICDSLGVTEVDKNARARRLEDDDWFGVWGDKGPRDDCGIAQRKSKFHKVYGETHTMSHATYINERGWKVDTTEAVFVVSKDAVTGELVLEGHLHTPHGMGPELRAHKVRSDVARAYVQITKAYLGRAKKLMRKFKIKFAALGGDWNLNFRFSWVRNYFRRNFAGWKMNWEFLGLPTHGTHGKEIIDGTLLKGLKPIRRKMLSNAPGDDHSGYLEHLVQAA